MDTNNLNYTSLSKAMSKALRHRPERIGITLAPDGSVEVDSIINALNQRGGWPRTITAKDIAHVVKHGSKQRFAIENGRIRALYGHSIPLQIAYEPAQPPAILYHGTNQTNAQSILVEGLLPMGRQMVHLSTDVETACQVGFRHRGRLVILIIDAAKASHDGIRFYRGNNDTWLANSIPTNYLRTME